MAAQFTQSGSPSQADTTVKVSLDECAVVHRSAGVELMTDGLSGCVAIGIRTGDKLALTHVYSDAIDHFDDYRAPIGKFVESVGSRAEITEVHIMHNGNPTSQKHGTHLQGMIEDHLVSTGLVDPGVVHRHVDNGCTVADSGFYGKRDDNKALYVGGYTNTALDGAPEAIGQGASRRSRAIDFGSWMSSSSQVRREGPTASAMRRNPSVRKWKFVSSMMPTSGPQPARNASTVRAALRAMKSSQLRSGKPRPTTKPGR